MTAIAFFIGMVVGAGALVAWLERASRRIEREQRTPLRLPTREARCVPAMHTPAARVTVVGARETYTHPDADRILLQRQLWAPGGSG